MATEVGGALGTQDGGCRLFLIEKCLHMPSDKSVLLLFMTGWLVHLFAHLYLHTPGKAEEAGARCLHAPYGKKGLKPTRCKVKGCLGEKAPRDGKAGSRGCPCGEQKARYRNGPMPPYKYYWAISSD